ncbi:hypothetical protein RAS_10180 [Rickettsia asiatica]|uniref:Uncharacterized protein n=1 Tax=Rickettsia asiatica TaxID=238800 RepID=A0A510GD25_9RICK|nr:hypothetical protein [Rickettsia asiatica]BBJ31909.1 hypothetical protein RAS_10180 [Rickettsia asiatica]
MSAYRIIQGYKNFKQILQTSNFKQPKIFNKFNSDKKLKAMEEFSNLIGVSINEGFQNALKQSQEKTAQRLLSSKKFDHNYIDSKGSSVLKNIVESQNTSLLKNYFSKVEATGVKLENSSISEAFDIALKDKAVFNTFLKGLAKLNDHDQLQTQSLDTVFCHTAEELPTAPPQYSEINDSSQYQIIGDAQYVN